MKEPNIGQDFEVDEDLDKKLKKASGGHHIAEADLRMRALADDYNPEKTFLNNSVGNLAEGILLEQGGSRGGVVDDYNPQAIAAKAALREVREEIDAMPTPGANGVILTSEGLPSSKVVDSWAKGTVRASQILNARDSKVAELGYDDNYAPDPSKAMYAKADTDLEMGQLAEEYLQPKDIRHDD